MAQVQTVQSVQSIIREAKDALAKCDGARVEEILIRSCALTEDGGTALGLRSEARAEFDAFARFLELARENMRIIRRSSQLRLVDLEYQPFGRQTERGALY
jgi:hypothetical protein